MKLYLFLYWYFQHNSLDLLWAKSSRYLNYKSCLFDIKGFFGSEIFNRQFNRNKVIFFDRKNSLFICDFNFVLRFFISCVLSQLQIPSMYFLSCVLLIYVIVKLLYYCSSLYVSSVLNFSPLVDFSSLALKKRKNR